MRCPACGERQRWGNARFGVGFECEHCGRKLRVPESYTTKNSLATIAISIVLTYFSNATGYWILIFPVALVAVCGFVIITISRYVFPPRLQLLGSDGDSTD